MNAGSQCQVPPVELELLELEELDEPLERLELNEVLELDGLELEEPPELPDEVDDDDDDDEDDDEEDCAPQVNAPWSLQHRWHNGAKHPGSIQPNTPQSGSRAPHPQSQVLPSPLMAASHNQPAGGPAVLEDESFLDAQLSHATIPIMSNPNAAAFMGNSLRHGWRSCCWPMRTVVWSPNGCPPRSRTDCTR